MTWKPALFAVGYFWFFILCTLAVLAWEKRKKKRRTPFGNELKLLRSPGETQLKQVLKFEENLLFHLALVCGLPMGVITLFLLGVKHLPGTAQLVGLVVTLIAFLAAYIVALRWFTRRLSENSNRYLGYFGERYVAEALEPLKARGWRIFHDVPAMNNGHSFNLDHVAVGPGGVFCLETKTWRKGPALPGRKEHSVSFNGSDLEWPWGADNAPLDQAERNASWLARWLKNNAEPAAVSPLLVLPGWWIDLRPPSQTSRTTRVMNEKWLEKQLGSAEPILGQKQIATIATALEKHCRDVEY
ncbi:nuclease-related domain-containing protein [Nibricoccus aquaticus]|nr:nuclease-related domain-containing protein [Nibricoccus aquaticus]